jgi:hypothetical protein
MPSRKIFFLLSAIALIAIASRARGSAWNYGCKGVQRIVIQKAMVSLRVGLRLGEG